MVRAALAVILVFCLNLSLHAQNLNINDGACVVPLRAASSATIDPATGDIRVLTDQFPICGGGGGGPSVTLSALPGTVNSNESFTVSWSISPAANANCVATGGAGTTWSQTSSANLQANNGNGSRVYALTNGSTQATSVTFTLACTFQSGSVAPQNASVTINGTGGGGSCTGFTPPNTVIQTEFSNTFGFPEAPQFPGRVQGLAALEISVGTNRAVRFTMRGITGGSNNVTPFGSLNLRNEQGFPQGPISAAIKSCPGDFRNLGDGCNVVNNSLSNQLSWTLGNEPGFCKLVPGQVYYINIVHGLPPNLSQPTCPESSCVVFYKREK